MINIYIYSADEVIKFIISKIIVPWKKTRHIDEDYNVLDVNSDPKKANLIIIDCNFKIDVNKIKELYIISIGNSIPCIVLAPNEIFYNHYGARLIRQYSKLTIGVLVDDPFDSNNRRSWINYKLQEQHIFDVIISMFDTLGDNNWMQSPEIIIKALDVVKTIIDYIRL